MIAFPFPYSIQRRITRKFKTMERITRRACNLCHRVHHETYSMHFSLTDYSNGMFFIKSYMASLYLLPYTSDPEEGSLTKTSQTSGRH